MTGGRMSTLFWAVPFASLVLAGCQAPAPAGPCTFTANVDTPAYRLPDSGSAVFGTMFAGETYEALAQTAGGWVGLDPGVAQAPNVGLARHRYVQANITFQPSCLSTVQLVTLADVEADVAASGG